MDDPKKIALADIFCVLCQNALKFGLSAKQITAERLNLLPITAGVEASNSKLDAETYPLVNGFVP